MNPVTTLVIALVFLVAFIVGQQTVTNTAGLVNGYFCIAMPRAQ